MKIVFLSHRFDFLEPEQVDSKTKEFSNLLAGMGVTVISMTTLADERKKYLDIDTIRTIVQGDLDELKKADILLMDVSLEGWNYIGVTCEMVYAFTWGKPIIAYVGNTTNGQRLWLQYHVGAICHTLDEVKNEIRGLLDD